MKLWTGKTGRQELALAIELKANLHGCTINDALEAALDGAEQAPPSSMLWGMQRYWDMASAAAQTRLLGECRARVRTMDRLTGKNFKR